MTNTTAKLLHACKKSINTTDVENNSKIFYKGLCPNYSMAGNIGGNYIVRFHEKTLVFISRIKYCVLTAYTVSHPQAKLLFCLGNKVAYYFFWVKDDDQLRALVSREKYLKAPSLNSHCLDT